MICDLSSLRIWIDPGESTANEIAAVLVALSEAHRSAGGKGLTWKTTGASMQTPDGGTAYEHVAEVIP